MRVANHVVGPGEGEIKGEKEGLELREGSREVEGTREVVA